MIQKRSLIGYLNEITQQIKEDLHEASCAVDEVCYEAKLNLIRDILDDIALYKNEDWDLYGKDCD